MKTIILVIVVIVFGAGVATGVFAALFAREVARIERAVAAAPAMPVRDDLPAPVRAFADRGMMGALPAGAVRLTQAPEMRLKPGADWQPLTARQVISAGTPGFAWIAAMTLGPMPIVRVIDSYTGGMGLLDVRLLGAFRMGVEEGPEAALGEAMRYLAELPWSPDAILTNPELRWAVTPDGVSVALDTAGGEAQVNFGLDANGDVVTMQAEGRPAKLADGTPARLGWRGAYARYSEIGGRRIPVYGEVGYVYPEGFEAYWRGEIISYGVID